MNWLQVYRKLRRMPAHEIQGRVAERLRLRRERRDYQRRQSGQSVPVDRLHEVSLLENTASLLPGTTVQQFDDFQNRWPMVYQHTAEAACTAAEQILRGEHRLLGHPVDLAEPAKIDWHRDPRSDYRWPSAFHADVPIYELPDPVDVKYVWELSRHQYLVTLMRAWRFSGEARYPQLVRQTILDWIEANPVLEGVNWTSALEVAVRAISWIWSLGLSSHWDGWKEADVQRIAGSLVDHAEYLARHFSFYSSPYNHLIGEAAGLLLIGQALAGHHQAAPWQQIARTVLVEHGPRQFYADGFTVEQGTGYHFFTLGFLVQAALADQESGGVDQRLQACLQTAFLAGRAFRQADGRWPAIGDVDSARSIPVEPDDFWSFDGLGSLAAVHYDLPEWKTTDVEPGEELYWLLGTAGLERWDALPETDGSPAAVLPDAGYAIVVDETTRDWVLLDAGPLAAGVHAVATPSVAHGHADALQVLVGSNGAPWLVDSGMASYAGDRAWVDHFRKAEAHNCLAVEGMPWAQVAGRLAWSDVGPAPTLDAQLTSEVWVMRAKQPLVDGSNVERHVLGLPGVGVWIADFVDLKTPRQVRWYWQMPREVEPVLVDSTDCQQLLQTTSGYLATWTNRQQLRAEIESAVNGDPKAWQAADYGQAVAGCRAVFSTHVEQELAVVTSLGSALLPATITRAGGCFASGHRPLLFPSPWPADAKHEVLWHVETSAGLVAVAAGIDALQQIPDGWHMLTGQGNWSVSRWGEQPKPVRSHTKDLI